MKKLWELEAIGVSTQEETVHEKFLDTIHLNNDRYGVSPSRIWRHKFSFLLNAIIRHHVIKYEGNDSRPASVLKLLRKNPRLLRSLTASLKSNPLGE